ncbi:OLC1v1015868C1 [Oldenlandia corymbosa var. corymbosa]|uniref:OLC1v1015868C1 n=1 Tax=Oldenlandia corymbosa var. corymbosa TaxID=529605 RepID=A0AAV1E730_OLDCO|nr:OLC1v1015868C1 [Oldenlandia corymbosa var. corymbosa]
MMRQAISWIPFFLVVVVMGLNFIKNKWKNEGDAAQKKQLPPGPRKLPIIGNMHQLMGSVPHRALWNLARKHGDLMHLQLGEISTIVASSPSTAEAILKTHDLAFANKPNLLVAEIMLYNGLDMGFAPHGYYWREIRKICTVELLGDKNVRSLSSIRQDKVAKLVSSIRDEVPLQSRQGINVTEKIFSYTSSMVYKAVFGQAFGRHREELQKLMKEVLLHASGLDVADVFPSWKILHYLSSKPKLLELHKKLDKTLDTIIQEHVENPTGKNGEFGQEDLIDVLLRIKQNGTSGELRFPITNTNIKAILLDMFIAGTETSSAVVDWAMAEMIRNRAVLARAQSEIRKSLLLLGKETIEENDVQRLSYLQAVIKETLRLHPPTPLLMPRNSREQCKIEGYIIPPNTRAMVNVWAIGRDPRYWDDSESFRPERFEEKYVDFVGTNYEYLPFGAGRRSCPGTSFGLANVEVPLANLLYYFDWKLPDGIKSIDNDMTETNGITASRKNSLFLVASMDKLFPMADIVTPNLKEASALFGGMLLESLADMRTAAKSIHDFGPKGLNLVTYCRYVLVKGGDLLVLSDAVDVLYDGYNPWRIDSMETTLDHFTIEKMASAKDISIKTNVIMDMLNDLAKKNKFLKVKIRKTEKDECLTAHDNISKSEKMLRTSRADSAAASLNDESQGKSSKSFSNSLVEETLNTASSDQNEMGISNSAENSNNLDSNMEDNNLIKARKSSRMYIVMAMLIVLLAGLAAYFLNSNHAPFQFLDAYNPLVF